MLVYVHTISAIFKNHIIVVLCARFHKDICSIQLCTSICICKSITHLSSCPCISRLACLFVCLPYCLSLRALVIYLVHIVVICIFSPSFCFKVFSMMVFSQAWLCHRGVGVTYLLYLSCSFLNVEICHSSEKMHCFLLEFQAFKYIYCMYLPLIVAIFVANLTELD